VTGFGTAHELRLLRNLLQRDDLSVAAVVFQVLPNNDLRDNWEDGGFDVADGQLVALDPPRVPTTVWLRDALLDNWLARSSRIVTLVANALITGEEDASYGPAGFDLERRLLQAVVASTQQHGIPIVILVTATSWEIDKPVSRPYDERSRLDFVAATVQELHVPWVDSRNIAHAAEHYIPDDGHLSAAGNALVGAALAEKLAPLLQQ